MKFYPYKKKRGGGEKGGNSFSHAEGRVGDHTTFWGVVLTRELEVLRPIPTHTPILVPIAQ